MLSHLGVPVLWDNARSRGVFFWGVAGRRAPCMHWGQVEAPHSRAARPPQPAVLQVGAEGCGCCSARPCSPRSAAACKSAAEMRPGGFASHWCPLLSSCLLGSTCTRHLQTANCCTLHPCIYILHPATLNSISLHPCTYILHPAPLNPTSCTLYHCTPAPHSTSVPASHTLCPCTLQPRIPTPAPPNPHPAP